MTELVIWLVSALWLGILTSISPCPLATNIAAISYLGRRVDRVSYVLLSGMLYTVGRAISYIGLAFATVSAALSVPQVSRFLQAFMPVLLGPVLILVGMLLLELIQVNFGGMEVTDRVRKRADALGIWGALFLGAIFALSFCPTSAALFFGSLIPLSLKTQSRILLPLAYGIGTALPVITFAAILTFCAHSVGKAFNALAKVERSVRILTGIILIAVGIYFSFKYIFFA